MSTSIKCPVCGQERTRESSGYDCDGCGFQNAFVRYFVRKEGYEKWLSSVKKARKEWGDNKREETASSGHFWVADHSVAFLDDNSRQMYIVLGSGRVQTEPHAVEFSASERNYAVLYGDGTVKVFGEDNEFGQKNTETWKEIRHILAGANCTYGITERGEVVYAGSLADCAILKWTDLSRLKAAGHSIVGIHTDGRVSIAGSPAGERETDMICSRWDLTDIAIARDCIWGLTKDGKIIFAGKPEDPRREAENWKDVIALAADNAYVYGLTREGRLHIAGKCKAFLDRGRSLADRWENLTCISCNQAGIGAVSESGEFLFAGTITGDFSRMQSLWKDQIMTGI